MKHKYTYVLGTGDSVRRVFEFYLEQVPGDSTPLKFAEQTFGEGGRILEETPMVQQPQVAVDIQDWQVA